MRNVRILERGAFESPLLRSRIDTRAMTTREKILGYMVGPAGLTIFTATIMQLQELYYTSVIPIDALYGSGTYLAITMTGRVVGLLFGLLLGWLVEHTVSSQGRIRPYMLIGALLTVASGFAMFWVPDFGKGGRLLWIAASYILYNGVALVAYGLRTNLVTLSTRNQLNRTQVALFNNVSSYLIAGVFVGLMVSSVLYYIFLINDKSGGNWVMIVGIAALFALPLLFVEYYNTKERVTTEDREARAATGGEAVVPVMKQMKAFLTNKYWILAFLMTFVTQAASTMRGLNITTNFCQWILGANSENNIQLYYTITSGVPLGLGVLAIYPLAKKFGVKPVTVVSFLICLAGIGVCMISPYSAALAIAGGFIYNVGRLANIYIFSVLTLSAADSIEYKSGFRPEGTVGAALMAGLLTLLLTPFSGLYETVLVRTGYDAYAAAQPLATRNWILFANYGVDAIGIGVTLVLLLFYTLEKNLPRMQRELLERRKAACLARGEEWVDPAELERREREESARLAEEARRLDLKARCAKKGLDFQREEAAYQQKQKTRAQRRAARTERRNARRKGPGAAD